MTPPPTTEDRQQVLPPPLIPEETMNSDQEFPAPPRPEDLEALEAEMTAPPPPPPAIEEEPPITTPRTLRRADSMRQRMAAKRIQRTWKHFYQELEEKKTDVDGEVRGWRPRESRERGNISTKSWRRRRRMLTVRCEVRCEDGGQENPENVETFLPRVGGEEDGC